MLPTFTMLTLHVRMPSVDARNYQRLQLQERSVSWLDEQQTHKCTGPSEDLVPVST